MKHLLVIAVISALAFAKPELYKESEDFQYSRSSSDEGSKSGFYGAQRGNMGGNFEKAHNMDGLAQHQMSGLVRTVDGELGDGYKLRTGSVYSAANSRGVYGSGNYDLGNLQGRNFEETESFGGSHSSRTSQSSGFRGQTISETGGRRSSERAHTTGFTGYRAGEETQQLLQTDHLKSMDNLQTAHAYDYGNQAEQYSSSGFQSHRSYDQSNANVHHSGVYETDSSGRVLTGTPVRVIVRPGKRLTVPFTAQTYDGSGTSSSFDVDRTNVNKEAELLSSNRQTINYRPAIATNPKHYESSYSYHKAWEKHDTQPVSIPVVIPTESSLHAQNEGYDEKFMSNSENAQKNSNFKLYNSRASNAYNANTKSAASSRTRYQAGYNAQLSNSASLAENTNSYVAGRRGSSIDTNTNGYNVGSSNSLSALSSHGYNTDNRNLLSAATRNEYNMDSRSLLSGSSANEYNARMRTEQSKSDLSSMLTADSNNLVESLDTKPKSYHSSYSYHKAWERQGDPYVIKPAGSPALDGQMSQKLTAASSNRETYSNHYGSHYKQANQEFLQNGFSGDCVDESHIRVARSSDPYQRTFENIYQGQEDYEQQSQSLMKNSEDLGQHTQSHWDNLHSLGQETQNQWDNLQDLGQQTQMQWDNLQDLHQQPQEKFNKLEDLGQQTQNQWDNLQHLHQQPQEKFNQLEDLGQQTQNQWDNMQDLHQQPQEKFNQLEDLGQQTQNQWDNMKDLHQQPQEKFDKLEDLGQQPQNQFDNMKDLHQQPQEKFNQLEDLGQQTQNQWDNMQDLHQQPQEKFNQLEDLGQQTQNQWDNMQDLRQQPQEKFDKLEDLGQQPQNQFDNMKDLHQQPQEKFNQLEDLGQQTQNQWDNMQDLHQQPQEKFNQLEDLGQQTQNQWDNMQDLRQQPQEKFDKLEDLGQQPQNQFDNMKDLHQQPQEKFNQLEDLGQQTQNQWDNMQDLHQQPQEKFDKLEDLGQQTQSQFDNMKDLHQQPQEKFNQLDDLGQQTQNQWDNMKDLHQQPQEKFDKLENLGQQTQNQFENTQDNKDENLGQQTQNEWDNRQNLQQQTQEKPDKPDYLGQQTQNKWDNLEHLDQQTLSNVEQQIQPQGVEDLDTNPKFWTDNAGQSPERFHNTQQTQNSNFDVNSPNLNNWMQNLFNTDHFHNQQTYNSWNTGQYDRSANGNVGNPNNQWHVNSYNKQYHISQTQTEVHTQSEQNVSSLGGFWDKLNGIASETLSNDNDEDNTQKHDERNSPVLTPQQSVNNSDNLKKQHNSLSNTNTIETKPVSSYNDKKIQPMDIGRGDIGPEDTDFSETTLSTDLNKSSKFPDKPETTSLKNNLNLMSIDDEQQSVQSLNDLSQVEQKMVEDSGELLVTKHNNNKQSEKPIKSTTVSIDINKLHNINHQSVDESNSIQTPMNSVYGQHLINGEIPTQYNHPNTMSNFKTNLDQGNIDYKPLHEEQFNINNQNEDFSQQTYKFQNQRELKDFGQLQTGWQPEHNLDSSQLEDHSLKSNEEIKGQKLETLNSEYKNNESQRPDMVDTIAPPPPPEPETEKPGFWKSVGSKLSNAKNKVYSWFSSS